MQFIENRIHKFFIFDTQRIYFIKFQYCFKFQIHQYLFRF